MESGPLVTYYADIKLSRIIDLEDPAAMKALDLELADLKEDWSRLGAEITTQLLGKAVEDHGKIAGVRYASKAAANRGKSGFNYVIFEKNVVAGSDSVQILGPDGKPLQQWP